MEQQVTVIAVDGAHAVVRGRRASACGSCVGKTSCSTLGSWVDRFVELRVKNTVGAHIGDDVLLEVPDSAVMKVAFRLYAVPMVAFVVAGLGMRSLAVWMGWPAVEAIAALAGFAAVLAYYACYKVYLADHQSGLEVRMMRVLYPATSSAVEVHISAPLLPSADR